MNQDQPVKRGPGRPRKNPLEVPPNQDRLPVPNLTGTDEEHIMQDISERMPHCGSRLEVIALSSRAGKQLAAVGANQSILKDLDRMATTRLGQLKTLRDDLKDKPIPKLARGYFVAPTPRLGERVIWYQTNDRSTAFAADVVAIESPGRVQLRIVKSKNDAMAVPEHVMGVIHASDPVHDSGSKMQTVRHGSWDYLADTEIPANHYEAAMLVITKREDTTRRQELQRMETERAILEQEELARQNAPQAV